MSELLDPFVTNAILERDPESLDKLIKGLNSYASMLIHKHKLAQNLVFSIFR